MTTEADLLAAIVADPDDPAPFLVYADFLQAKGDPRGELITLMNAGDDKLVKQALRTNKAAFIGPLAKLATSIKLEAWRLGFVDHVRLIADDEKHALLLLDQIADHPSTRFVRKLELLILGKRRSYTSVDARLVELGRPRTLKELVLGKPGEHALSAALVETFPLLSGTPRKTWEQILAGLRGPPVGFARDDVAPLALADGSALPMSSEDLLRGLAAEVERHQPLGLVTRLVDECTPAALDQFAASLVTAWTLHGEEPRTAWVYDAASILGGARAARNLGRRLLAVSHARAEHAVGCLARMRTPLATLELYAASRHWGARGEHAETALEHAARRAKVDFLTLLARAGSDPRDAYDDETLARFCELDLLVLELLMIGGWTAPLATVMDLFARAPRHAWASTLVWRARHETFVLTPNGPVERGGAALALPADTPVSLVHVAEPDIDVTQWRGRPQAIEQLVRRAPKRRSIEELVSLVDYRIDVDVLRARTYRNGGVKDDLHEERRFVKTHRYRGTTYALAVQNWGTTPIICAPTSRLPPVVLFEFARDIEAAAGPR